MSIEVELENGQSIAFSSLTLSQSNPRYKTINRLDGVKIAEMIVENFQTPTQFAADELYRWEGDLKDFLSLFNSLKNSGFDQRGEKIILIKISDKYVVAEGNRRIWALKLIAGELEWKNSYSTDNQYDNADEDFQDAESDNSFKFKESLKNNFNQIKNILSNWKKQKFKVKAIAYDFNDIQNNLTVANEFLNFIYLRNIEGVQKQGQRPWGRGKWFADLLSQNKTGLTKNLQLTSKITGIEQKKIRRDYGYALFVHDILKAGSSGAWNSDDQMPGLIDGVIELMKKQSVSALQDNFSLTRIKTSARDRLNISTKDFKNDYFYFQKVTEKAEIICRPNKSKPWISEERILKFIFHWWKKGFITTRPVRLDRKTQFEYAVVKLLKREDINPHTIKEEKFTWLNILELDKNELEILSGRFPNYKNLVSWLSVKRFFSEAKEEEMNLGTKFAVFPRLYNQMLHNLPFPTAVKSLYFNAVACSIRSFYEQFLTWIFFYLKKERPSSNKFHHYRYAREWFKESKNKVIFVKDDSKNKFVIACVESFLDSEFDVNRCIHTPYKYLLRPKQNFDPKLEIIRKLAPKIKDLLEIIKQDNKFRNFVNSNNWPGDYQSN